MRWALLAILWWSWPIDVAAADDEITGPARAFDSDVLRMGDKFIILYGIDGPERSHPCFERDGRPWTCHPVAVRQLNLFVDRVEVRCVPKGPPDVFKRIPAVCHADGRELNEAMVRAGFALAAREQTLDYVAAEEEAKEKKAGMWRGTFMDPKAVRELRRRD